VIFRRIKTKKSGKKCSHVKKPPTPAKITYLQAGKTKGESLYGK